MLRRTRVSMRGFHVRNRMCFWCRVKATSLGNLIRSFILVYFVLLKKYFSIITCSVANYNTLDVFAHDQFSVMALIPSKCTKERPLPFRKISNWRRCLGAKNRDMCLKKRYVHGIASFLKKNLKVICALAGILIPASV